MIWHLTVFLSSLLLALLLCGTNNQSSTCIGPFFTAARGKWKLWLFRLIDTKAWSQSGQQQVTMEMLVVFKQPLIFHSGETVEFLSNNSSPFSSYIHSVTSSFSALWIFYLISDAPCNLFSAFWNMDQLSITTEITGFWTFKKWQTS